MLRRDRLYRKHGRHYVYYLTAHCDVCNKGIEWGPKEENESISESTVLTYLESVGWDIVEGECCQLCRKHVKDI